MRILIRDVCLRCGRCVRVCPSQIFVREAADPEVSGAPEMAGVPEMPESLRVPGVPEASEMPGMPEMPEALRVPGVPEASEVSEASGVSEASEMPEMPEALRVPGVPEASGAVSIRRPENCIRCGHCVAACPADAIEHEAFPPERIHAFNRRDLPTPEQVELLLAVRRSNRALSQRPVPQEWLDRIVAAADRAPTASNARGLGYLLVTDPETLRRVTEYTLAIFRRLEAFLANPLVRPWLSRCMPGAYRYLPVFARLRREYAEGRDRILRGASALLFIHAPKKSRFAAEDANLACQNASLMAEALGVSQIYMGFVLTAIRQDRRKRLNRMFGLEDRRIGAILAFGMPEFACPRYIDRDPAEVRRI